MPKLYVISGCNGSGKTTASYTLLPDFLGCNQFVNSDEFAQSLSPFDPSAAHITASRYMVMKINYMLGRYESFGIETTLATRSLVRIIEEARTVGYEIILLYLWLNSPELAIQRVKQRVEAGGHNIPEHVIRRRYVMGLKYFFETYKPLSDLWILADNSKPPLSIVAKGNQQHSYIRDNEKFRMIWNTVYPNEKY